MSNFWDTVLLMVSTFFFIAYLIADAKKLLDAGTINGDEFARLKAKALA